MDWKKVCTNNLKTLAIHAGVAPISFIVMLVLLVIFELLGLALLAAVIGIVVFAAVYAYAAYRFLAPLAKGAALSFLLLPVLLAAIPLTVAFFQFCLSAGIWFGAHFDRGVAHSVAAMTNLSSLTLVTAVYELFVTPDIYTDWQPPALLVIAAFIPSILMYFGLRLKMRSSLKGES